MNHREDSQIERVREVLQGGGSITPLQALQMFNCFRLASIIYRLRAEGLDIITDVVTKYGEEPGDVKTFARYHVRKPNEWR